MSSGKSLCIVRRSVVFFFFFSSRRRHTRFDCDWSSDVCSSDLSLRASVLLSTADHPPGSLLVTSTQPGEGKTTVATNLALSLAQLGQRVLLDRKSVV